MWEVYTMKKIIIPLVLSIFFMSSCSLSISNDESEEEEDNTVYKYELTKESLSEAYNDSTTGNYTVTFYSKDEDNKEYEYYFKFEGELSLDNPNNGYGVNNIYSDLMYLGPSGGSNVRQYMYITDHWEYNNDAVDLYTYVKYFADILKPSVWTLGENKFTSSKGTLTLSKDVFTYNGAFSKEFCEEEDGSNALQGEIYKVEFKDILKTKVEIDPTMESTAIQAE